MIPLRPDLIVSVVVAALGSPLLIALGRSLRDSWSERRDIETEVQRQRRHAARWEALYWETRSAALREGVPGERLPRPPDTG